MTARTDPDNTGGGWLPPRWFIRTAWAVHRGIHRLSGRRFGLRPATQTQWGMMRLRAVGRRSGKERAVILGYFEDGQNLVTLAMNGWMEPEPAWWLNLQSHPDVVVELPDGARDVRGREATPEERPRLWARWGEYNGPANLDGWAARRPGQTAVVVLEPREAQPHA